MYLKFKLFCASYMYYFPASQKCKDTKVDDDFIIHHTYIYCIYYLTKAHDEYTYRNPTIKRVRGSRIPFLKLWRCLDQSALDVKRLVKMFGQDVELIRVLFYIKKEKIRVLLFKH